jgi:hypothetical protein
MVVCGCYIPQHSTCLHTHSPGTSAYIHPWCYIPFGLLTRNWLFSIFSPLLHLWHKNLWLNCGHLNDHIAHMSAVAVCMLHCVQHIEHMSVVAVYVTLHLLYWALVWCSCVYVMLSYHIQHVSAVAVCMSHCVWHIDHTCICVTAMPQSLFMTSLWPAVLDAWCDNISHIFYFTVPTISYYILSFSKAIPYLCIPNCCYCIHKCFPLSPILSQMNPVHTVMPYFFNILKILIQLLRKISQGDPGFLF